MPYTTLVPGTAITASWANANVRDQVVTPFANAAARDSAITVPVEGMLCYLADADVYTWYNGSAWVNLPGTAIDIVNVTTNPIVASSPFSSETDLPPLKLTANLVNGVDYVITGGTIYQFTNTTTEVDLIFRYNTALTGTLLGKSRLGLTPSTNGYQATWNVPFKATSTGSVSIYVSALRTAGGGNAILGSANYSFNALTVAHPSLTIRTA